LNVLPYSTFIGRLRGFGGCLPCSEEIADMFTYLQENYEPKHILEFGFRSGHSATWFLRAFSDVIFKSYDPKELTLGDQKIHKLFYQHYYPRFDFRPLFSAEARRRETPGIYDMIFIDGGHTFGAVYDDIETALLLKIPVILIDNMELEAQQKAVSKFESNLELIKTFTYYTINNDNLEHERYVNLYHVLNYDIQEP
jgi:predicted O-methyltransferase YrrM